RSALDVERCDGRAYASLSVGESRKNYPELKKRLKDFDPFGEAPPASGFDQCLKTASDQALYRAALEAFAQAEELAELRRKLYVGLTRASEALVVALSVRQSGKNPLASYKDVVDDLRCALCGQEDFPQGSVLVGYGHGEPLAFERIAVAGSMAVEEGLSVSGAQGDAPCEPFFIPVSPRGTSAVLDGYRPRREGLFSYSSLAQAIRPQREQVPDVVLGAVVPGGAAGDAANTLGGVLDTVLDTASAVRALPDADKATDLGSAFHLLAQYALEAGSAPPPDRVGLVAEAHRLSESQVDRLAGALAGWLSSDLFREMGDYCLRRAELSFFVPVGEGWLEGEIDAFCSNGPDTKALVVDYKTGGGKDAPAALREKHLLQATCYAYAVLAQGYPEVELRFVYVEQPDRASVDYRFTSDDLPAARQAILETARTLSKKEIFKET
ncbi:MAG: PD-(D/E)XK nuclease family protein, partial [Coriobacteriaceae bacterium]|nr:PD-(D/E)XK nuclease family protein [Coriobacteriaceae bacterium]